MRSRSTNNQSRMPETETGALARAATSTKSCFGKNLGCPSSDDLLQLCEEQRARCELQLSPTRRDALQRHLSACDFCAAESQLLAAHASQPTKPHLCATAQMPVHLYALARALLPPRPPHDEASLAEILQTPIAPQLADAV